jgi:hypothetical protein
MISYIRQIYYKPAQLGVLDPLWYPYKNVGLTPYFENDIIKELYLKQDHKQADYYGVFSHKFFNKHKKDGGNLRRAMEQDEYAHDVYSFFLNKQFKGSSKANTFYDTYHPNLLEIGSKLVKRLFNEDIAKIKADRIYYNHWIARSDVFDGYCRDMLLPAMDLMEGELKELVWTDATYKKGVTIDGQVAAVMSAEQCMAAFGVPYYTHHAFVLERLPSIYFALKGHTIKQL